MTRNGRVFSFEFFPPRTPEGKEKLRATWQQLARLGPRAAGGIVTVSAADTRSQWRNRAMARRRLEEMLREALREDPVRFATRVTSGARRRRAESKRRRSALKRLRRPPEEEE